MDISWKLIVNLVFFQLGWFACLLLDHYWPVVIVTVILSIHFFVLVPRVLLGSELLLFVKVLCVGIALEVLYLLMNVVVKVDGGLFPAFWLLLIWLLFASTLRYSLSWLADRLYLSAVFAAVAAPMSYYAGVNLNANVDMGHSLLFSLCFIALTWALVFPALLRLARTN